MISSIQGADTEPEQGRELHVHQLHRDRAQSPLEAPALRELLASEVAEGSQLNVVLRSINLN